MTIYDLNVELVDDNVYNKFGLNKSTRSQNIEQKLNSDVNQGPTLLRPSFGNHLFANYHVLKRPLTNLIFSSFYIPKVLKSAAKILEIGSQIKI